MYYLIDLDQKFLTKSLVYLKCSDWNPKNVLIFYKYVLY